MQGNTLFPSQTFTGIHRSVQYIGNASQCTGIHSSYRSVIDNISVMPMLDSERYFSNAASEPISAFLPYIWRDIFMHRAPTFSDAREIRLIRELSDFDIFIH